LKSLKGIQLVLLEDMKLNLLRAALMTLSISISLFEVLFNILRGLIVCFPGVTTHCGCIFHSPVAGFSLLVFEVS